jgi:hypothetical protein
MRSVFILK